METAGHGPGPGASFNVANDPFMTHGQDAGAAAPPPPPPNAGPKMWRGATQMVSEEQQVASATKIFGEEPQQQDMRNKYTQQGSAEQDANDVFRQPPPAAIPVWYPADNNWQQCKERMASGYQRILSEFSGQWSQEQRTVNDSGPQRTRTVNVVDIFQDWQFPGDTGSWFRGGEGKEFDHLARPADWRRLQEYSLDLYPIVEPGLFCPPGGRIYQGALEDFYLVAALQAIGMKPQLIANIFANMDYSNPRLGVYCIRFYKHGMWKHVEIDDALPFDRYETPLCATSEFWPAYSWPCLIEKAYAKMHGSWEAVGGGGHVEEVLTDLTGGCSTRYGTTDVAADRLWQYLNEMQRWCVFACNINETECSKRSVPIEKHWAASIYRVLKHQGVPYVCVCLAAPTATLRHLPLCDVPSPEGLGPHNGFAWLRIDDFTALFDTIYECRLVNSDLGPPQLTGVPNSPGYFPGMPWFEEIWAFQGDVYCETAPSFLFEVPQAPNEITMEVSQTDARYDDPVGEPEHGRWMQAPLLLRFYECGPEVSDVAGGEVSLVHLSAWGHCRDACCGVKVLRPGKYIAMLSVPMKYVCHWMIFRTYSTWPIAMKPITQHRNFISVIPARPLDAIPYSLSGFQRVDAYSERMPQMFDEAEGRGKPLANGQREEERLFKQASPETFEVAERWRDAVEQSRSQMQGPGGMHVVGKFGGRDAIATTEARESQEGCSIS